jgi:hypothetical protein
VCTRLILCGENSDFFFVTTERFLVDEFAKRSVEREKFF